MNHGTWSSFNQNVSNSTSSNDVDRCRAYVQTSKSQTPASNAVPFDAYVVLDFEATCEKSRKIRVQEIIEFPMVVVNTVSATIVSEFQRYVKPVVMPKLSQFCTELTGITQDVVDQAQPFPLIYREALEFLQKNGLGTSLNFCFVTCGDWDLKTMLPAQLAVSRGQKADLPNPPDCFNQWVNIKRFMQSHSHFSALRITDMPDILKALDLQLVGRHHSGIDDCRNIAAALCALLRKGYVIKPTWPFPSSHAFPCKSPQACCTTVPTKMPRVDNNSHTNSVDPLEREILLVDKSRNPIDDLIQPGNVVSSLNSSTTISISKAMSHVLRHSAEAKGIKIYRNGFVRLENLLTLPPLRRYNVTPKDIALMVKDNNKQRFTMVYGVDGNLYVSANQGHSLAGIEVDLKVIQSAEEVPVAIHGTYHDAWEKIKASGYLSAMQRQHIHFAKGVVQDSSVISGMRSNVEVFLYMDVAAVLSDGIALFESVNGVILTPGVGDSRRLPLKYILKAVDRQTRETLPFEK